LNPLTPAQATIVAGTLLAIIRQLLQLERCSNPPRIQQVFYIRVKKNFQFWVWGSLGGTSQVGVF